MSAATPMNRAIPWAIGIVVAIAAENSARHVPYVRAALIKAKLREIRRELTGQNPKQ